MQSLADPRNQSNGVYAPFQIAQYIFLSNLRGENAGYAFAIARYLLLPPTAPRDVDGEMQSLAEPPNQSNGVYAPFETAQNIF